MIIDMDMIDMMLDVATTREFCVTNLYPQDALSQEVCTFSEKIIFHLFLFATLKNCPKSKIRAFHYNCMLQERGFKFIF